MTALHRSFAALGDPTRFAIVERLLAKGEQSAGELHGLADISAPAISRHLKVLREAGIVAQRVERQRRMYSARPEAVQAIAEWTQTWREFWETSLKRLEIALERETKRK
jgi:DNA-binding transcriptional ArsR family regulator